MLKKSLALWLLFLAGTSLYAQFTDINKAAKIARNFYYLQQPSDQKIPLTSIVPDLAYTAEVSSIKCYYVFNMSSGGFVIVSASEAVPPVLGYAFKGSYQLQDQPPAFTRWMQDYRDQIRSAVNLNLQPTEQLKDEWARLSQEVPLKVKSGKSVEPMILTNWDQGKYYNEFCPADPNGTNGRVVVGCVPTALGQIMNYYHWPIQGTGSYSYTDSTYGVLSADFSATRYRWNEMPLKLTAYNDPVAELVYHLGVSVDLKYGPDGSGMYNHKAAYALRTYFGYDPSTEYIFRDTAVHTNWKQLVLNHLDNHRPLYYAGWADTINVSGHAFVCDGYQDTTYFHMNWGWSGYYDGYFMLDDLTPGVNDFTLDHELIVNIFPYGTYPPYCTGADTLTAMNGTLSDGSGPVSDYGQQADCSRLIAPEDSVSAIQLTFKQFSLAAPGDTVYVYNGKTTSDPLLGKFSGSTLPPDLSADGQYMLVRFVTDDTLSSAGWVAEYKTVIPVYCTGIQLLTGPSGSISDGSGPRNYHNGSTCRWRIEPAGGATTVQLQIHALDLAEGDVLEVYDGVSSALLASMTADSMPGTVIASSAKMLVVFRTDTRTTAGGFDATYNNTGAVEEPEMLNSISLYPNPAKDALFVSGYSIRSGKVTLQLWNSAMKQVWSNTSEVTPGTFLFTIPADQMSPGLYLLRMTSGEDQFSNKIVITK